MNKKNDIIKKLFFEAESYRDIENLEQLFESDFDLTAIPIQPLYLMLKNASFEVQASVLPKLSSEQRQVLYDIDGWSRDDLDLTSLSQLPIGIIKSGDLEVIQEFASSDLFFLYLKGNFAINTFDLEESNYPEHDNFFLTDDNAFIIEFNDDCDCVKEVQYLIKNLYAKEGVTKAYHLLIDLINQSYYESLEQEYNFKKERLREYGFVDAFEALEKLSDFRSLKQLNQFIKEKELKVGNLDSLSKSQALHSKAMVGLVQDLDKISKELAKLNDESKQEFLQFDFIRMINSTLTITDAFKKGTLAFTKANRETKAFLLLGLEYIQEEFKQESIFERFTFMDLYRVGKSLIKIQQAKLKKEIAPYEEGLNSFWGRAIDEWITEEIKINSYQEYQTWCSQTNFSLNLLPYITEFKKTLDLLIEEQKLSDHFYLNYSVDEIDFEAIILSSLINFSLGYFEKGQSSKMGVQVQELIDWTGKYLGNKELRPLLTKFANRFGLSEVQGIEDYLSYLVDEHLSGYDFPDLSFDDFKHIGGPILLNMN